MSTQPEPTAIDQLEKLALTLLLQPDDTRISRPRLFLGTVPEQLPVQIPIPEQSRVLGTLARNEADIEVALESDLAPEAIFTFYLAQLPPLGWQELEGEWDHLEGGFVDSAFGPHVSRTFCQEANRAGMTIEVLSEVAITRVRLHLSLDREENPCTQWMTAQRQAKYQRIYEHIPPLLPPRGGQQTSTGGSGSPYESSTHGTLISEQAIDALATHYAEQLIHAGWRQAETGMSGPLAWHSWHFTGLTGEPWSGLFFIHKAPERADHYFLFLRITLAGQDNAKQ